ncbi:MAG: hypothetical protein A2Y24_00215 [Clostridiales bacterium GWE2_32_10]|nr:MAG: hypothetical protein A2Y24_00215 [Clostridiales bacterium GWE2_32_10]HBY20225.1 hypothetical protein [Clostridiales bacterium]
MSNINPIEILGNWDKGYVIDYHSISSEYIGDSIFGHPMYDTVRTEIGQYMNELKYKGDLGKIDSIIQLIAPLLDKWSELQNINVIIPVPPTNVNRLFQPVYLIADAIGEYLNKPCFEDVLV